MKNRLAPLGAALSVVALLAWLVVSTSTKSVPGGPPPAGGDPVGTAVHEGGSAVPCAAPLAWSVPEPDPRFGLSPAAARAAVAEAAALWEEAVGRSLFLHDPHEGFPIRFVYDWRQARGEERRLAEARFERAREGLEARERELGELREEYLADRTSYEDRVRELAERVSSHNAAVDRWSREQGAPEEVVRELRGAEEALATESRELERTAEELEALGRRLEAQEAEFGRRVEEHRREGEALERAFMPRAVEAGTYREEVRTEDGAVTFIAREIRVHRFSDRSQLVRVLAHELGHALGVGHASVPGSLMSPEHGSGEGPAAADPPTVGPADLELLRARCPDL